MPRRKFLKQAAVTLGAVTPVGRWPGRAEAEQGTNRNLSLSGATVSEPGATDVSYPRVFRSSKLKMLSFPLGGVGAGSLGLGGRGQLRDWEIFNRPNKRILTELCLSSYLGAIRKCISRRPCPRDAGPAAV